MTEPLTNKIWKGISMETKDEIIARLTQQVRSYERDKNRMGLTFQTQPEQGEAQKLLQGSIPLLQRVPEYDVIQNETDPDHLLIEGDNISSLTILQQSHRNKVDVIYIDPPYNTGNEDFVYNDRFVNEDDGFRHSKWLSFMRVRLELAKNLLKDSGAIFVSIDDHEQAYLKILMDEIFGVRNFVGDVIRKTKSTTNDARNGFNQQHEYLLVYAKDEYSIHFQGKEKDLSRYKNPDNDPLGDWISSDPSAKSGSKKNNWFPVVNPYTGREDYPPNGMYWRFSKNTIQNHIDNGTIVFKKEYKEGKRGFIYKRHLSQLKSVHTILNSLDTVDNKFMNQAATKESLNVIGDYFIYPKGISFLKHLFSFVPNNAVILDFFAGSGTTGQAVAELNAEDGGTRQAILCTNNFEQNGSKNGIARGITAVRMKRVLTGKEWTDGKYHAPLPGNLRYYQIVFDENGFSTGDYVDQTDAPSFAGIVSLKENAHTVLGPSTILDEDFKKIRDAVQNGDAIVLSSADKIVLVYGNLSKALFLDADPDFDEVVENVQELAEKNGKKFISYIISDADSDDSGSGEHPFPVPYLNGVRSSIDTLSSRGHLIQEVEEDSQNDYDEVNDETGAER